MFEKKTKGTFEGSPMEIIRRYAPYMIGAFAAVSMTILMYEIAFHGGESMIGEANGTVCEIMDSAGTETTTIISNFAP